MEPLKDASGLPQDQMTKQKRNRFAPLFVGSVTMALVLMIGTVLTYTARAKAVDSADAPQLSVPAVHQHDNEFARVAKAVEPTVVNINTESTIKNPHKRLHRMPRRRIPSPRMIRTMTAATAICRIGSTASSARSPTAMLPELPAVVT